MPCEMPQRKEQIAPAKRSALFRVGSPSTDADLKVQCDRIAAAGFDGVELVLTTAVTGTGTDKETCTDGGLLSASLARPQIGQNAVAVNAVAARCTVCDIKTALEQVTTLTQRAAGLRARCLNLTIPPLARACGPAGFPTYQETLNFSYELLHHARFDAEATGVAVALEAGVDGYLLSPVELREIIDAANSWAVGVCVDLAHIARIGSPADWLRTLRTRVHAVRVHGDCPGDRSAPSVPGEPIDLSIIAEALDEIHYDRIVIADGGGDLRQVRASLTRLGCPMCESACGTD